MEKRGHFASNSVVVITFVAYRNHDSKDTRKKWFFSCSGSSTQIVSEGKCDFEFHAPIGSVPEHIILDLVQIACGRSDDFTVQ